MLHLLVRSSQGMPELCICEGARSQVVLLCCCHHGDSVWAKRVVPRFLNRWERLIRRECGPPFLHASLPCPIRDFWAELVGWYLASLDIKSVKENS